MVGQRHSGIDRREYCAWRRRLWHRIKALLETFARHAYSAPPLGAPQIYLRGSALLSMYGAKGTRGVLTLSICDGLAVENGALIKLIGALFRLYGCGDLHVCNAMHTNLNRGSPPRRENTHPQQVHRFRRARTHTTCKQPLHHPHPLQDLPTQHSGAATTCASSRAGYPDPHSQANLLIFFS